MPAKENMSDNDLPDPSWSEAKKAAWDAQKKMDEDMNLAKKMTVRPGGGQEKKKNEERRRTKEVIAADEAAKREEAYSPSDKTANALLARERVRTFDQLTPTVPEHYDVLGLKPHHEIARLRMKGLNGSDGERLAALVMHQYLDLPDRESALRVIDLSWNSVGLTGATALARSLSPRFDPHRKKLIMSLDLSQNSIGTAGAVELAELLKVRSRARAPEQSWADRIDRSIDGDGRISLRRLVARRPSIAVVVRGVCRGACLRMGPDLGTTGT